MCVVLIRFLIFYAKLSNPRPALCKNSIIEHKKGPYTYINLHPTFAAVCATPSAADTQPWAIGSTSSEAITKQVNPFIFLTARTGLQPNHNKHYSIIHNYYHTCALFSLYLNVLVSLYHNIMFLPHSSKMFLLHYIIMILLRLLSEFLIRQ